MAEKLILEEGSVQVTTARLIVGRRKFSLDGILSVSSQAEHPNRTDSVICLAFGLISLLIGDFNTIKLVLVSSFLGTGVILWWTRRSNYKVQLVTASGHLDALESRNRAFIDRVTAALNEAILERG